MPGLVWAPAMVRLRILVNLGFCDLHPWPLPLPQQLDRNAIRRRARF